MRIVRLIAWREYMENVRTKSFWAGILMVPIIFIGIFFVQSKLSQVTPTRYYLLVDQTGRYEQAVQAAIDLEYQRKILQDFISYLLDNRKETDLRLTAANTSSAADQLIDDVGADEVSALNEWIVNGGLDFALTMAAPYLREDAPPFVHPPQQFIAATLPEGINDSDSPDEIVEQLRPYLSGEREILVDGRKGEVFALILIPTDVDNYITRPNTMPTQSSNPRIGIQYWGRNLTDTRLPNAIERSINREIRRNEFVKNGFDTTVVRNIQRTRLPLSRLDPTAGEGEEGFSLADAYQQFAPIGFVYFMFIVLMQSVQYLLSNTIEEKSNRIIEVLLASVTPGELMMGKLLGIGLSSLTTIIVWISTLVMFLLFYQTPETQAITRILEVIFDSELIPWFIFYTLAGYALYSGVFLAIGSLCNTIKEAQILMMPMIIMLLIPLTVMPFVVMDPNNTVFRIMSWFPLFTPYLMMNRAAANPPMVDVIGTTIVLVLSIVFVLWLSGRVFRQGVLRTGQPPRILELFQLMRRGE